MCNLPSPWAPPPFTARICVGKEWYRYPSSFFLGSDAELRFIQSGFTGQLPQPFSAEHGTWGTQAGFNDLNREEHSRYVSCTSMRASPPQPQLSPNAA